LEHTFSQLTTSLYLRCGSKLFECVKVDFPQSTVFGGLKINLWHAILTDPPIFVCDECLEPSRSAKAPFAPFFQPNNSKIIALRRGIVEEFFCDNASDCVISKVLRACSTISVSVETRYGRVREEFEGLLED